MIVLTHNDLDALGSVLVLEKVFKPSKYFYTNYGDMEEILEMMLKEESQDLFISDVSFTSNPEILHKLIDHFKNVTLCDHHMAAEDFFKQFDLNLIYDTKVCATKLLQQKYHDQVKDLDPILDIIDVYDIWRTDDPRFMASQDLNDYFWVKTNAQKIENRNNILTLAKEIIETHQLNDYEEITETCRLRQQDFEEMIYKKGLSSTYELNGLNITILKTWAGFNRLMISEMQRGQDIVVALNDLDKVVKIRINAKSRSKGLTHEVLQKMRLYLTGNPDIGHDLAFTYKYDGLMPVWIENFLNYVKNMEK